MVTLLFFFWTQTQISSPSWLLAGSDDVSQTQPLVGEFNKTWSFGESTSCMDKKRRVLVSVDSDCQSAWTRDCMCAPAFHNVAKVAVVGAVIEQAEPGRRHGRTLRHVTFCMADTFQSASPHNNQKTCSTRVCLTCIWQPAAMVVGITVKLTASTWPTADVWLAWTLVGVTGPSWIKNTKVWNSQRSLKALQVHLCAKCSLCTIPWL